MMHTKKGGYSTFIHVSVPIAYFNQLQQSPAKLELDVALTSQENVKAIDQQKPQVLTASLQRFENKEI